MLLQRIGKRKVATMVEGGLLPRCLARTRPDAIGPSEASVYTDMECKQPTISWLSTFLPQYGGTRPERHVLPQAIEGDRVNVVLDHVAEDERRALKAAADDHKSWCSCSGPADPGRPGRDRIFQHQKPS